MSSGEPDRSASSASLWSPFSKMNQYVISAKDEFKSDPNVYFRYTHTLHEESVKDMIYLSGYDTSVLNCSQKDAHWLVALD